MGTIPVSDFYSVCLFVYEYQSFTVYNSCKFYLNERETSAGSVAEAPAEIHRVNLEQWKAHQ